MKLALFFIALLLLAGCAETNTIVVKQRTSGSSSSSSGNEYSNLYIAHDTGEESNYNVSSFSGEAYEVHIE